MNQGLGGGARAEGETGTLEQTSQLNAEADPSDTPTPTFIHSINQ